MNRNEMLKKIDDTLDALLAILSGKIPKICKKPSYKDKTKINV